MTIGIKYCGGCNPRFDRTEIVEWVKRDFSQLEMVYLNENSLPPDFTLHIDGCESRCVAGQAVEGKYSSFSLATPQEYPQLAKTMQQALADYTAGNSPKNTTKTN